MHLFRKLELLFMKKINNNNNNSNMNTVNKIKYILVGDLAKNRIIHEYPLIIQNSVIKFLI